MAETKTPKQYTYGTGRRKSAVAQVRIYPGGSGKFVVNEKAIELDAQAYLEPIKLVGQYGSVDVSVKVRGGGFQGQVDAIRHGIARALLILDENFRVSLRKGGFLTRDPRERERKKPGLKSARRSPQWSKR